MKRILALVMVIFLLISVCATLIYYLVVPTHALDESSLLIAPNPMADKNTGDDKIVTVGLMFANGVTIGFETKADYGFSIQKINRSTDFSSEFLWKLEETKVSCTVDHNLSKAVSTYSKTSSADNTVIGGWHAEISGDFDYIDLTMLIDALDSTLAEHELYCIPSYIDGNYKIRVGHFATEIEVANCILTLSEILPGFDISVAAPSTTGVSVVNPDNNRILFEYDDKDVTALGLEPLDSPEGEEAYLITPAKNKYDGSFMFRRNGSNYIDGVSVTNVLSLGDYTKGVLPYEIGNTWPIESQKALAVCIRSHLLYTRKHSTFDACNDPGCCQQYKGVNNVNSQVIEAVDETAGLIIAYDGKGVCAYFSAVTGGCTVGNYEGFGGGQLPYLKAVDTPWEVYTDHTYGVWTKEVSPTKLCEFLQKKDGFTHLRGEIASIKIVPAENSTYVGQITFTDIYGNTATKKCNVYAFLYGIGIRSANFVVGKGSVVGKKTTFADTPSINSTSAITADGIYAIDTKKPSIVLTANGLVLADAKDSYTITANGTTSPGQQTSSKTEAVTIYAENPNNFIFYGKGWGHGVGASQVGMRDLAKLGYEYDEILKKYFTDIDIIDWRESK